MRPESELDLAPSQVNIGMMALRFRQFSDIICIVERFPEIFKRILLLQLMLINNSLPASQLFQERLQLVPF